MKIFAPIQKIDEEQRMVYGYASTEALDSQGEVVKREAIKAALPDYIKFGNIREMHQPSAVGVAKSAEMDDTGLYLSAKVVDDAAWIKVKEGVYKGFSIGGAVKGRDPANKAVITDLALMEISLVDRPANPEAVFEMFKADLPAAEPSPNLLKQAWTCAHPGHEHFTKAEATACIDKTPADERTEEARIAKLGALNAPAVTPPVTEPVKKGMGQVAWLADLVSSLDCLQNDTRWEAMMEGDGSTVPAKLKAAIDSLTGILKEMVAEEAAEMAAANAEADAVVTVVELAGKPKDLAKAAADKAAAEELAKAEALRETIAKAIADAVAPLQTQNEALQKRVEELAKQPAPAKGSIRAVGKGDDAGGDPEKEAAMQKFVERVSAMTPEQQATEMIKFIQKAGPQPVI